MNLSEKIRELEYSYTLDQKELGKILFIASTTLLIVSVTSLFQTRSTINDVNEMSNDFSQLDAVLNTQRFNDSLSAIQSLEGTAAGEKYQYAAQTFRGMQHAIDEAENAEERLLYLKKLYQWLTLISVLGASAGLTVIYI